MLGTRRASTMLECISRQRFEAVSINSSGETPRFNEMTLVAATSACRGRVNVSACRMRIRISRIHCVTKHHVWSIP